MVAKENWNMIKYKHLTQTHYKQKHYFFEKFKLNHKTE